MARRFALAALAALAPLFATAQDPKPVAVRGVSAFPPKLTLKGAEDAPQLAITGDRESGRPLDVTGDAKFAVADGKVARVDETGRVYPLANGSTEIAVEYNGRSAKVPVTVSGMEAPLPISFPNEIEPILTKLSCNSGGCHGKIQGQNGFRLSLLGFDPELDYNTLMKEGRGRRLFPASPDQSLFLLKGSGAVPHGCSPLAARWMSPADSPPSPASSLSSPAVSQPRSNIGTISGAGSSIGSCPSSSQIAL